MLEHAYGETLGGSLQCHPYLLGLVTENWKNLFGNKCLDGGKTAFAVHAILCDLLLKRQNMAAFKMLKLALGRHSPGDTKAVETVWRSAFRWLGENESFVSLFTFISLFLTLHLFLEQKRNRNENAHLAC